MHTSKTIKILGILALLEGITACSTMFGDNTRQLTVKSQPAGAGIYVDGVRHGTTPATITLPSHIYSGKVISVKKYGHIEQSATINPKFQPVGLWNILFWPGFVVDAATGNMVKVDPNNLEVSMNLERAPSTSKSNKIG